MEKVGEYGKKEKRDTSVFPVGKRRLLKKEEKLQEGERRYISVSC